MIEDLESDLVLQSLVYSSWDEKKHLGENCIERHGRKRLRELCSVIGSYAQFLLNKASHCFHTQ